MMKKRNISSLHLNKQSISVLDKRRLKAGAVSDGGTSNTGNHLTADCPGNTLEFLCESLGACDDSYWCETYNYCRSNISCWSACYDCETW
jgi:hypothetical protein